MHTMKWAKTSLSVDCLSLRERSWPGYPWTKVLIADNAARRKVFTIMLGIKELSYQKELIPDTVRGT